MQVYILTEGGKNIGFGHITRCISIYEAFKSYKICSKMIVNGDESVESILTDINFEINNWLSDFSFLNSSDIIVIDSYMIDLESCKKISNMSLLTVYFDDNNRLDYPKGIVINGLINSEKFNYPIDNNKKYLLGSNFSPLRSDFWNCKKIKINEEIKNVLITTGGNDLRNLTPKILDFLNTSFKHLNKKVIIADSFNNISEIESLKNDSCELFYSPNSQEMLDIMSNVDLAISSSGQTLYELACLGIPTIAIGIIDNQKENIKNFQENGFIEYAGCWNNKDLLNNISNKIKLLEEKNERETKQNIGIQLINGNGSLKIVKSILNEYYIKNSKFREINEADCLKIFEIANDDEVRASSFNSDKIELETHKRWFKGILKNDLIKFLVLEYAEEIIGQLRFDFDEQYPVVSISLNKNYRGLGLSKYLLKKGFEYLGEFDKIVAYIKKDNIKSISFFKSMGFKLDCKLVIKDCEALKFIKD